MPSKNEYWAILWTEGKKHWIYARLFSVYEDAHAELEECVTNNMVEAREGKVIRVRVERVEDGD